MPDGADPPADAYAQARRCLEIIVAALREAGAGARGRRPHADVRHLRDRLGRGRARARRGLRRRRGPRARCSSSRSCSTRAGWSRSRQTRYSRAVRLIRRTRSRSIPPRSRARAPGFAPGRQRARPRVRRRATRTRSASRRSTCSSTARRSTSSSTSTPCSRRSPATSSSRASTPELMQSVLEIATPVCHTPADVDEQLRKHPRLRHRRRARAGHARRLGRHAPVQPLRAPADHGARPLPRARRPDAVRRAARADLRDARPRRRGRPGEGDPGRQRAAAPPRPAARALGELAVLARRADGPRARAGRWSSPRSRAPARRRASATTPTTRRSSASSRRPAASRTTRTSGGTSASTRGSARSRSGSATRSRASRTSSRSSAYCQALVKHYCERFERGEEIPSYHRILTTENKWLAARYGLEAPRDGSRHRAAATASRRAAHPPHAEGDRAARPRARLGARARGDRARSCARATAPTGSSASSTRTATSSRSRARSRTQPRSRSAGSKCPRSEVGVLATGDRSAARVGRADERRSLDELSADGRALFLFYLFDWSST